MNSPDPYQVDLPTGLAGCGVAGSRTPRYGCRYFAARQTASEAAKSRLPTISVDGDRGSGSEFVNSLRNRHPFDRAATKSTSPVGFDDSGVFRGDGQSLEILARFGNPTPDGQRNYDNFFGGAINNAGQVAFKAWLHDAGGQFAGDGLYLGDGTDVIEITRSGRPLAGSTVDRISFSEINGLNELGQVAYRASLNDGREGVFLYTLEDVVFRTPTGGAWDDVSNWTLGTRPGAIHNITVNAEPGAVVTGPAAPTTVKSLTIGSSGSGVTEFRLNVAGPLATTDGTIVSAGGRLSGAGALDGSLTIQPGGELLVLGGDTLSIDTATFDNQGKLNVVGGELFLAGPASNHAAGEIVGVNATLNFADSLSNVGELTLIDSVVHGAVDNQGLVTLGGLNTFANEVSGGGSFVDNGRVVFESSYAPGETAALIEFGGDVSLATSNTLQLDVGGQAEGTEFDALRIAGSVELGGNLEVSRLGVFEPALGDEFNVIEALAGLSGEFQTESLPELMNSLLGWDVEYTATDVTLRVVSAIQGDLNGDGPVNFQDLTPFALGLTDVAAFEQAFPDLADTRVARGDINRDDSFNFGDLTPFVGLFTSGGAASGAAVPEPSTSLLVSLGMFGLGVLRLRK